LPLSEAALSSILAQVSKRILEKLEKGKKLSTEDILLLYMDMTYTKLREIKEELREVNKRIDETNKRIDTIYRELSRRIDETREQLASQIRETNKRIDETNRRIDRLYELLAAEKREKE